MKLFVGLFLAVLTIIGATISVALLVVGLTVGRSTDNSIIAHEAQYHRNVEVVK